MALVPQSEEVFACFRRSCAPPPVGKGGSNKGGARGGDKARKGGIAAAKSASVYHNKKKLYNLDEETYNKVVKDRVRRKGAVANFKAGGGRKKTRTEKSDPMVTKTTAYDRYVELKNKRKK